MKVRTTDTEVDILKIALQIEGKFVKFHQQKYDNSLYCATCHDLEPSPQLRYAYISGGYFINLYEFGSFVLKISHKSIHIWLFLCIYQIPSTHEALIQHYIIDWMIYKNGIVLLGSMAYNTWMGLNDSLSPMKLHTNVCICSYASFSVDVPIFSSHCQIPHHFKPLCQTQAPSAIMLRWDGMDTSHPFHGAKWEQNTKMASSVLYSPSHLCPRHLCPPPLWFSLLQE